jgi:glutaredoxin domain-containing cysteine-rich protein 1
LHFLNKNQQHFYNVFLKNAFFLLFILQTYSEKEQGRVVVYTTSMGVVRATFLRCQKVKQILRNLLVKFDERDCYMNRSIQNEIRNRLSNQMLALPQVFLEGQLLGVRII